MKKTRPKRTHFIYALCDPDTQERRYVGTSVHPESRFNGHMNDLDGNRKKCGWVMGLKALNKKPVMVILEDCFATRRDWRKAERSWIRKLRREGHKLFNVSKGGLGKEPSKRPPKKYYSVGVRFNRKSEWIAVKKAAEQRRMPIAAYVSAALALQVVVDKHTPRHLLLR